MVPDVRARVFVSAGVSPTEDPAKVAIAVSNVLGGTTDQVSQGVREITYSSDNAESLLHLRDQLRDRKVRATAKRLMNDSRRGTQTELMINRQAAFVGVIALCGSPDESPLGPIYLRIESKGLDKLIDWLTAYELG